MTSAIRKLIAKLDKGPRELFFYPGLALLLFGAVVSMLLPDPVYITANISLDMHTFLVSALIILIGMQCVSFAVVVRRYAAARGLLPLQGRATVPCTYRIRPCAARCATDRFIWP